MSFAADVDAAVRAHAEEAFGFLERLVAAPSTVGHEQEAIEVFAAEARRLGFAVERIPLGDVAADPAAGVPSVPAGERGVVLGRRNAGAPGPSLLLNGHLDVVPADSPHLWASPPFTPTRRDGRLHGRGAGDMKCGFAMGALAIAALDAVDPAAISGPLSFLGVIEEECTGNGTLAAVRAGAVADAVVVLETTGLDLLIGCAGVLWLDVDVVGRPAHAGSAHLATNAIDLAMNVVAALRAWQGELSATVRDPLLADLESPYNLNLGGLVAGDWTSSVPATAHLRVRIGFPRAWTPAQAEARAREVIAAAAVEGAFPQLPAVRSSGLRAAGYALDADHPLALAVAAAHERAHGRRPRAVALGATTDARTYLEAGIPALCFGPTAHDIHGLDESVELASIVDGAITLAHLLRSHFAAGADRG